jgi:hypothetical protein
VVDHLIGTPDDRDLKYAILHLAAAIEGFVKARLPRARRSLICTEFDRPSCEAADGLSDLRCFWSRWKR